MANSASITPKIVEHSSDVLVQEGKKFYGLQVGVVAAAVAATFGIGKVVSTMTPVGRMAFGAATLFAFETGILAATVKKVGAEKEAYKAPIDLMNAEGKKSKSAREAFNAIKASASTGSSGDTGTGENNV